MKKPALAQRPLARQSGDKKKPQERLHVPHFDARRVPFMNCMMSVRGRVRRGIPARMALSLVVLSVSACGGGPAESAGPAPAVYTSSCSPCHDDGLGGAPMLGDQAEWERRIAKGINTVRRNAIDGFEGGTGIMPRMGGRPDLSADEISSIVDWMIAASQ
ncbi:MAG: cytochrome c5 family protein [Gammaproteobacteria bacterium]|nr:MAG: cytochrome c5 family protein [Gammaproteobacteria bacterium]